MSKTKAEREAEDQRIAEYMRSPAYQDYARGAYGTAWEEQPPNIMPSAEQPAEETPHVMPSDGPCGRCGGPGPLDAQGMCWHCR